MSDSNAMNNIDINKFKKIDLWNRDNYTDSISVLYDDKRSRVVIEKDTKIQGCIKKGSHICVIKGEKANKINSVIVITAAFYNKMKQEQSRKR